MEHFGTYPQGDSLQLIVTRDPTAPTARVAERKGASRAACRRTTMLAAETATWAAS
jgi:hypothetical protein